MPARVGLSARRRRLDHRQRGANGCSPTWASSAPAAFRPASIRPIPRPSRISHQRFPPTRLIFAGTRSNSTRSCRCRTRCPTLQKIVVFDMEGLSGFISDRCAVARRFMAIGRNHSQGRETLWDEMVASRGANESRDPGLYIGHDRAAKAPCIPTAASRIRCATPTTCFVHDAEVAAGVPAALPTSRADRGYYLSTSLGSVMNFAKARKPCRQSALRCSDRISSRRAIWENFSRGSRSAAEGTPPRANWMYRRAGDRQSRHRVQDQRRCAIRVVTGSPTRAAYWRCSATSARMLGLDRCRQAFTGAARSRRI